MRNLKLVRCHFLKWLYPSFTVFIFAHFFRLGPATVRMISENRPDFPLPLHLPPGHVVQQVLDENGVLTHVIVSQTGPLLPPPPPLPHHHLVRIQLKYTRILINVDGLHYSSIPVTHLPITMDSTVLHITITHIWPMGRTSLMHYLILLAVLVIMEVQYRIVGWFLISI